MEQQKQRKRLKRNDHAEEDSGSFVLPVFKEEASSASNNKRIDDSMRKGNFYGSLADSILRTSKDANI